MKIVVAVDSFKGSLSSLEVGQCIQDNIHQIDHNIEVVVKGIADGGEGTVEVLSYALNADIYHLNVHNAYGDLVDCLYAVDFTKKLAIIEVAQAIGLAKCNKREPRFASTYGVGEVILLVLIKVFETLLSDLVGVPQMMGGLVCYKL